MLLRVIVQTTTWLAFMGVILFVAAGNWRWTEGWAFLAIFAAGSVVFCAWLLRRDPALLAARMGSLVQKDQPLWDKIFMSAAMVGWNVWLVFMALDAQRFHWSHLPVWLQVIGGALIIAGFLAVMPVFRANSFAAPVVRVQGERGQRVIDTGPYALVRHPMYAAAMLYLIGLPLLLGSWYGLIGTAIIMLAISWRATREEQTLKRDLSGYDAYMARVPWRLIPHVW
jgi:protein-S-isoprenylcysteine O-methyltransferase Ste14